MLADVVPRPVRRDRVSESQVLLASGIPGLHLEPLDVQGVLVGAAPDLISRAFGSTCDQLAETAAMRRIANDVQDRGAASEAETIRDVRGREAAFLDTFHRKGKR